MGRLFLCTFLLGVSILSSLHAEQEKVQPPSCQSELVLKTEYLKAWIDSAIKWETLAREHQLKLEQITKERDEAQEKLNPSSEKK